MHLTRLATDVFGAATIILVSLVVIVGLLCIYRSVYFQLRIRRQGSLQLSYFNGPWIIRIALILVSVWWGLGEIARLSFLKREGKLFSNITWRKDVCKFYILSNLGFAEPSMFLMLVFLLHAALQKREAGTLSRQWNRKTFCYIILCCSPIFILQLVLILIGPKFNEDEGNKRTRMAKFFTSTYSSTHANIICTYPLLSTIFLGSFDVLLISYVSYIGRRLLSLVINKGLRKRVYFLIFSVVVFLPLRMLLLGFSVLPRPGSLLYESTVFLAFLMLLACVMVGICMLVHFPVAESLALRDVGRMEIEGMPYDDYYYDGVSLIANQSHQEETGDNSEASTKRGSISFRIMIKDENRPEGSGGEASFLPHGSLNIVSP